MAMIVFGLFIIIRLGMIKHEEKVGWEGMVENIICGRVNLLQLAVIFFMILIGII